MESKDYGIGYTQDKKYEFYFDKEDFDIVKEHCWYSDHYGYMVSNQKVRQVDKKTPIKMHRFILIKNGLLNPDEKELVVDHINGIPYDNRKENLRVVTRIQNQANMKLRKDSSTGVKGVYFYKNKYQASMVVNHKKYHIGSFDSLEKAQRAYKKAEEELRGEYARSEENVHNGCLIKDETA